MFAINLERSVVTLAVMAGLLAVAGPASAQGADRVGATGLKFETEVTDTVRLSPALDEDRRFARVGRPVS
jgi:hypothetical protein